MRTSKATRVAKLDELYAANRTLSLIKRAGFLPLFGLSRFAFLSRPLLWLIEELVIALFAQVELFPLFFIHHFSYVVGGRFRTPMALQHPKSTPRCAS